MKKWMVLSLTVLTGALVLVGCGSNGKESSATKAENTKILSVGSTALQPLVEQASKNYMDKNPSINVSVQGGGSGTGLSQVSSGNVDVGNSDVFAEEKSGVDATKLVDHKVAVVAMAPVVNDKAGVTNLTQDQLIQIFTGKVTNWKEVGGKDQKIAVINRAQGSGTRATFEKWGLKGAKSMTSQEQDSSGTVKKMVSEVPGAISYLALSYIDSSVQEVSVDNIKPTENNVTSNTWKIWSYEHMYTNGAPSKTVAEFIKYIQGSSVQKSVVKKLGYISISDMTIERTSDGKVSDTKTK